MKDYFAIIGLTTAITAAAGFVAWNALSEAGKPNEDISAVAAAIQPISVPAGELPESTSESLKNKLAESGQAKSKLAKSKPVITIEEIDPQDRKKSIKARLEEAKAKAAKKAEAAKSGLEKKAMSDDMAKSKEAKDKSDDMAAKEEMQAQDKEDNGDPGTIVFGSRLEPFPTPVEKQKIPGPMELINANTSLLTNIVNSKSGPSPEGLHGTWEVMPCHSSVGVIATRSFETQGLTFGQGPYYEIVQFYADMEKKIFSPRTTTTVYVSLDEKHMLAAVNANTNLPQFSVLRKVSSEIRDPGSIDAISEVDFPNETEDIDWVHSDENEDDTVDESEKDEMQAADKTVMEKSGNETAKSDMKKSDDSGMKKSGDATAKTPAKDKANASGKKLEKSPSSDEKKISTITKSKI